MATVIEAQHYMVFERGNIFAAICFLTGTFSQNARFCVFIQARATRSIWAWSCSSCCSVSASIRTSAPCSPWLPFWQQQNSKKTTYCENCFVLQLFFEFRFRNIDLKFRFSNTIADMERKRKFRSVRFGLAVSVWAISVLAVSGWALLVWSFSVWAFRSRDVSVTTFL